MFVFLVSASGFVLPALDDHIVVFPTKEEFENSLKKINGEYFVEKTNFTDILNQRLTLMEVLEKLEKACDDFYSYRTRNCQNKQRLALEMMIIERKKDQILNALLQNDPIAQTCLNNYLMYSRTI